MILSTNMSSNRHRRNGRNSQTRRQSGRLRSTNSVIRSAEVIDVESMADSPTCIDLTEAPDEDFVDLTNVNNVTPVIITPGSHSDSPARRRRRQLSDTADMAAILSFSDDSDGEDLLNMPFTLPDLPDLLDAGTSNRTTHDTGDADSSLTSPGPKTITCPVCLDSDKQIRRTGRQIVSTTCGHIFCNVCVKASIQTQKKCPNCRKKLTLKQFHPIYL